FPPEIVEIERAILFVNVHLADDHTPFLECLPRRHVRIMVQGGHHDFIPCLELPPDRARERKGDGGHVLPEHDLARMAVEKIRHCRASGRDHRVVSPAGLKSSARIRIRADKIDRKSTRLNSSHVAISYAV